MGENHFGNQRTNQRWITLLVGMMLSLAACMPVRPVGTLSTTEAATAAPTAEATQMPTVEVTTEPTVEASQEITPEATAKPAEEATTTATVDASAIVTQVTQMLAQQIQISADQITVVSAEPVDWPDACLGVESADTMCAQVITPGYRIVLSANGQQYEYHTNKDGSFIQLASAPQASIGDALISWQQSSDTCRAGQIGSAGVAYGPCMGVMMDGKLVT